MTSATFTAIDLSRLPAPTLIETLSYEATYAEMLAKLKESLPDFDDSLESDPAVKVLQLCAYFRMLDRQRVNDAARALMIAFATGSDLDQLGARPEFNVARLELAPADPVTGTAAIMESDDEFRRRIVLAPEAFSVAGPSGAYISHALSADPDVLDASAVSPSPAVVNVYVLSRTGTGTAAAPLLATVTAALSGETVRPIGDRLTVYTASIVTYAVTASIKTFSGPDPAVVLAEAQARIEAYVADAKRLGRDITRSAIFAALHVAGVQNVTLTSPAADLVNNDNQAGHCTGITLTYAGVAE